MIALQPPERRLLREFASKAADIAAEPIQEERRNLWTRHNRLEKVGPLILCSPEGAWREILPHDSLTIRDPFWAEIEWELKALVRHFELLHDDRAIEPVFRIPNEIRDTGWGMKTPRRGTGDPTHAWKWDPPLTDPNDLSKLHFPEIVYDEEKANRELEAVQDAIGDRIEVRRRGCSWWNPASVVGCFAELRGMDQLLLDLYDRPEWVHEAMAFFSEGAHRLLKQAEALNLLELNNRDHFVGSGGLGYTNELPSSGFDGVHVRLKDTWGFAEAQEVSEISPQMHVEFCLRYQIPLLEEFGLNCYNCCEDISRKFAGIKKVPRLRRVSVSPFTDRRIAAEELQDRYVYSWKPNPVMVAGDYDPDHIRRIIRETLDITKDCVVEMILKDTHTVQGQPERLTVWTDICREEVARAREGR